jgi:hypothetical protein
MITDKGLINVNVNVNFESSGPDKRCHSITTTVHFHHTTANLPRSLD